MADLRSFVFLDSLQPQLAAYLGTTAKGFLPIAGEASLIVEISPGIEINRVTDVAVKATDVRPGMQIVERLYGMLEIHHHDQAEVRRAGQAILDEIGATEEQRIKPEILSSQVIRHLDDRQIAARIEKLAGEIKAAAPTELLVIAILRGVMPNQDSGV